MAFETITLTPAGKKFWNTKRKSLLLDVREKVTGIRSYWSGGSCDTWWTKNKNGQEGSINAPGAQPFDNAPSMEVATTADTAVVCGGTFDGKPALLKVYVLSKEGWVF